MKFNPQKAAELQASISGQAVPIATKGVFLFGGDHWVGTTPTAGASVYATGNGQLTIDAADNTKVGKTLGAADVDSSVLVKLEL